MAHLSLWMSQTPQGPAHNIELIHQMLSDETSFSYFWPHQKLWCYVNSTQALCDLWTSKDSGSYLSSRWVLCLLRLLQKNVGLCEQKTSSSAFLLLDPRYQWQSWVLQGRNFNQCSFNVLEHEQYFRRWLQVAKSQNGFIIPKTFGWDSE